ncbi:MAG TPA: protein disulfide oxidoreductase [Buttiauxella sp.]|jgi:thiol-disulfide isomerase/thioredoxin
MLVKLRRWAKEGLVLAVLLSAILMLMDWWRAPQRPASFDSAPMHTLDGRSVTLTSLSDERPLLLYFWASWCGVCRYTTPDVARLVSQGENVMTIALRSGSEQQVSGWLEKKKVLLPVINDERGTLSQSWEISVTPTIVVLYKGEIVSSTTGWTSYWGMKMRLWWASL